MSQPQASTSIAYLNGLSVGFHIYRELVRSLENIATDKDISYRDKKDKMMDNCTNNLEILERMMNQFKSEIEELYPDVKLVLNPETREYDQV